MTDSERVKLRQVLTLLTDLLMDYAHAPMREGWEVMPSLLDVPAVAKRLDISAASVYRLARDGKLAGVRVGANLWRFRPEDVDAFIQRGGTGDAPKEQSA